MAPRTQIVKIDALLLSQFGLLTRLLAVLSFHLFEMVTAYKMMELKRNQSVAAYLSARNDAFAKKEKKFPNSPSSPKALVGLGFCPGERVHKGITIVLSLFRSHWLAVVYCLVL